MLRRVLSVAALVAVAAAGSQAPADIQTPFDLNEVIEKVSHHPIQEGSRIVIRDRAYRATFDERGVVLEPRRRRDGAEDLVIPIQGRPLIQDGRVVFHTEHGDIRFEGTRHGLKFEQLMSHGRVPAWSGNVAKPGKLTRGGSGRGPRSLAGEFLIDTTRVLTGAEDYQWFPAVASDGNNWLVAWIDEPGDVGLYAARVSPAGELLDSAGILITSDVDIHEYGGPAISFDGTNYLVVWGEEVYSTDYDILGARIAPDGTILDPSLISICDAEANQITPGVAAGDTTWLVVWTDDDLGEMHGARVRYDGTVLDAAAFLVGPDAYCEDHTPGIAFDGTNWLVVWEDWNGTDHDVLGARTNQDGVLLDPTPLTICAEDSRQVCPKVVFGGSNYFVVWRDYRNQATTNRDIYGTRLATDGTVLDPSGIAVSTASGSEDLPVPAFDGTNYLVVWVNWSDDELCCARVDQSGIVLDPAAIVITGIEDMEYPPGVAWNGTSYLVAFEDERDDWDMDIWGARIAPDGTVLDPDPFRISFSVNESRYQAVAFDGVNYLVVWCSEVDTLTGRNIYGARVSPLGTILSPGVFTVSDAPGRQYYPAVACCGTNYLVTWVDGRSGPYDVYGTRVSLSGTVLDPAGIPISVGFNDHWNLKMSSDGTDYFVAWEDWRNGWLDIYGCRVAQDGTVLDPAGIPICTETGSHFIGSVLYNGLDYFVVWQDYRSGSSDVYGARVSRSGTVLDPTGIPVSADPAYQEWFPTVASSGTACLVVWQDNRNGGEPDIYGARVDQSGTVLDPAGIAISTATGYQEQPQVAFGATDWLVTWLDGRNGTWFDIYGARVSQSGTVLDPAGIAIVHLTSYWWYDMSLVFDGTNWLEVWALWDNGNYDLCGATIDQAGVVLDSFALTSQSGDQRNQALACGAGSQVLITYEGWTTEANGRPANTTKIWGTLYGSTATPDPGWVEMENIPSLPGNKAVKRGAWATFNDGDNLIYATKGYKKTDFYAYNALTNVWSHLTGMPYTKHTNPKWARKVPRKGSKGVADGDNYIYVTQGNNTLGFWRYAIDTDSWTELQDVPVGPDRKKVKGGTDLAYLVIGDTGFVYCLKGYRCEFYRYNVKSRLWSTALAPAPKGTRGKWDKGSWLVAENEAATTLYAHKAKYNELWSYNVAEDSWGLKLTGMPFVGLQGRKKKSKDGGSADWYESEVYALKGGNTNEFWKYTPASDSWLEIDSMPTVGTTGKKKRVKYGADIVNYAGCPVFFTLKGNKTFEFWRYGVTAIPFAVAPARSGVMAGPVFGIRQSSFAITPNPLAGGYATVRYSLPKAGPAALTVVDIAGRVVDRRMLVLNRQGNVTADLRSLSAGVYLVRLDAGEFTATRKLVLER